MINKNKKIIDTESFIKASIEIHGGKYDYSKVSYLNKKTKVCIICPEHGEFWQTPEKHLLGRGCRKCFFEKSRLNTSSFIEKSKSIHGNRYDYSKVNYVNNKTPVVITCPIHGDFLQEPRTHLSGGGCASCYNDKQRHTTDKFIQRAKEIHGDKYDYSKVIYKNAKTKVCIICPIHGEFYQVASAHLKGHGCQLCLKHDTKYFVESAKKSHGEKYDYSQVDYINNNTPVEIICPKHGSFFQRPKEHTSQNQGCPHCHPQYSKGEKEVVKFIRSIYTGEIVENCRDVISPRELDIYLPELKIAFEYNGLYYHSSGFNKNPSCSRNKFLKCEEKGIRLITVYEDEWVHNKEVIKSMISRNIGIFDRIFARKTLVKKITDSSVYSNFLLENHIQGKCAVNFAYGLYYEDELVSVMTFTRPRMNMGRSKLNDFDKIELSRFCNKKGMSVIGGASKLLSAFIKSEDCKNISEIYSYSDNRISQGNLYKSIGFTFERPVAVNYFYTDFKERCRKQHFRKSVLKEKGIDTNNKTEFQLAEESGWYRIYDCGKRLWTLKINKNETD